MSHNSEIIRFPQTILASCARERLEDRLRRDIADRRESGQPVPEAFIRRLSWHPELASQLLCAEMLTRKETELLLTSPDSACSVLLENYASLCPLIEPRLLGHPPSIERLLVDQRQTHRPGLHTETEYLRHLRSDADRHYRLTSAVDRPIVLASLRDESERLWGESPSFAYFYLATHDQIRFDPQLAEILKQDEEYLYLALRILRGRQRPESEIAILGGFQTAAWAFHALRERLLPEKNDELIRKVQTHPAWLAEWWQAAGWDGAKLEDSYRQAADGCARHELLPELYWFYRTAIARAAARDSAA